MNSKPMMQTSLTSNRTGIFEKMNIKDKEQDLKLFETISYAETKIKELQKMFDHFDENPKIRRRKNKMKFVKGIRELRKSKTTIENVNRTTEDDPNKKIGWKMFKSYFNEIMRAGTSTFRNVGRLDLTKKLTIQEMESKNQDRKSLEAKIRKILKKNTVNNLNNLNNLNLQPEDEEIEKVNVNNNLSENEKKTLNFLTLKKCVSQPKLKLNYNSNLSIKINTSTSNNDLMPTPTPKYKKTTNFFTEPSTTQSPTNYNTNISKLTTSRQGSTKLMPFIPVSKSYQNLFKENEKNLKIAKSSPKLTKKSTKIEEFKLRREIKNIITDCSKTEKIVQNNFKIDSQNYTSIRAKEKLNNNRQLIEDIQIFGSLSALKEKLRNGFFTFTSTKKNKDETTFITIDKTDVMCKYENLKYISENSSYQCRDRFKLMFGMKKLNVEEEERNKMMETTRSKSKKIMHYIDVINRQNTNVNQMVQRAKSHNK